MFLINWIKRRTLNFRLITLLSVAGAALIFFGVFGFLVLKKTEGYYGQGAQHLVKNYSITLKINNDLSEIERTYQILAASQGVGGIEKLALLKELKTLVSESAKNLIEHNNAAEWANTYVDEIDKTLVKLDENGKLMVLAYIQQNQDTASEEAKKVSLLINNMRESTKSIQIHFSTQSQEKLFSYFSEVRELIVSGLISLLVILFTLGLSLIYFTKKQLGNVGHQMEKATQTSLQSANLVKQQISNISDQANSQAASIQESSASLKEINAMVLQSSEHADHSAQTSNESADLANSGQQVIQNMIHSIGKVKQSVQTIQDDVEKSNNEIQTITNIMLEIGEKTKVINEIVFQTKLLSFNASVEAARAGEHGRGFAVVAEEIGNLALLSGQSAAEISGLLNTSIDQVSKIIDESKKTINSSVLSSQKSVEESVSIAHKCESTLKDLVENVLTVKKMTEQISLNSKEQAIGVSNISEAIIALEQSVQENSVSITQSNIGLDSFLEQIKLVDNVSIEINQLVFGRRAHQKASTSSQHNNHSIQPVHSSIDDDEFEGFTELSDDTEYNECTTFDYNDPLSNKKSIDELDDHDFDENDLSA